MTETLQVLHALHAEMRAQRLSQEHLTNSVLTALQRLKEPKKETLILGPGGFTYESEGYPFNALVVSDNLNGTDIEITERGQTYTYTLQAGWNVLNVSDGAYLTSSTAISVMLVRDTRELFATFGTRVTVENATSNPVKTQLTGRNVTEISLVNALAITDITEHDTSYIDISAYPGEKSLILSSTLNQAVTVMVYSASSTVSSGYKVGTYNLSANNNYLLTSIDIAQLAKPFPLMAIGLQCSTAPTSGSVTVLLEGAQN